MRETPPVELMIMSGPDDGTLLRLTTPTEPGGYVLGRREHCDVVLPYDSQISRNHARLSMQAGAWILEDLESRNGTYIGARRLQPSSPLLPGELFRMGRTWMRIQPTRSNR